MQTPRPGLRIITATLLLGLFAFILVEKNTHGHELSAKNPGNGQATIQADFKCLICDFQLAADTDLLLAPVISELDSSPILFPEPLPLIFFNCTPFSPAERGPPAFSPAIVLTKAGC